MIDSLREEGRFDNNLEEAPPPTLTLPTPLTVAEAEVKQRSLVRLSWWLVVDVYGGQPRRNTIYVVELV
ncbi:hypothetical protein AKJ16_DCAP26986 [Drosera capensis]